MCWCCFLLQEFIRQSESLKLFFMRLYRCLFRMYLTNCLVFSSCDLMIHLSQNDKLVACATHFLLMSCPLVPKPAHLSLTLLLTCMKVDRVRECASYVQEGRQCQGVFVSPTVISLLRVAFNFTRLYVLSYLELPSQCVLEMHPTQQADPQSVFVFF